jgi:hypothetical protein
MHSSSVAVTGSVELEDVVAGWKLVTELLRPVGLSICEHIGPDVGGFTYIVYQPRAHRAGHGKYLYAGGSMRHPLSSDGGQHFGSGGDTGYGTTTAAAAVRFVISTTGNDLEGLNSAERQLRTSLNVAADPRFWNQHNDSGTAWVREVALAAWRAPPFSANA